MENSLFFNNVDFNSPISDFLNNLSQYSEEKSIQIYAIKKPLVMQDEIQYDYEFGAVVLVPKHKIIIIDYGNNTDDFEYFCDDIISDLESLSKKYDYLKQLGRKRNWEECIVTINHRDLDKKIDSFLSNYKLPIHEQRKVDLLISLLIGSINNIDEIGIETPEHLLDKVKKKIVLFDGMQSRFIYESLEQDVIKIQGLAGTGKTELLLHKLRELYVKRKDSKIAFTCHNKILAEVMRERIPNFFNFMKVEEQIEWNSRLWVFHSWGSRNSPNSGMYSLICNHYKLEFKRFSTYNTFDTLCLSAINELKQKEFEPLFDYIFIDESQDFTQSFFDLCQMICKTQVLIAGDIFQNIFDTELDKSVNSDYLLNKCYRTEPKTLMLAHSIGLGLYEGDKFIRWLEDVEWKACGYQVERKSGKLILKRSPLRRFEDIEELQSSVTISGFNKESTTSAIISCMNEIVKNNPTIEADDIAIAFLGNNKFIYKVADELVNEIRKTFNWKSTQAYISKNKVKGKVCITNTNNIKGLEFPFVICVETGTVTSSISKRNSIYMILTRSFIGSYFLVNETNEKFIEIYSNAIAQIDSNKCMMLDEPDSEAKARQADKIRIESQKRKKSAEEIINEICDETGGVGYEIRNDLQQLIPKRVKNFDEDSIRDATKKMLVALLDIE